MYAEIQHLTHTNHLLFLPKKSKPPPLPRSMANNTENPNAEFIHQQCAPFKKKPVHIVHLLNKQIFDSSRGQIARQMYKIGDCEKELNCSKLFSSDIWDAICDKNENFFDEYEHTIGVANLPSSSMMTRQERRHRQTAIELLPLLPLKTVPFDNEWEWLNDKFIDETKFCDEYAVWRLACQILNRLFQLGMWLYFKKINDEKRFGPNVLVDNFITTSKTFVRDMQKLLKCFWNEMDWELEFIPDEMSMKNEFRILTRIENVLLFACTLIKMSDERFLNVKELPIVA